MCKYVRTANVGVSKRSVVVVVLPLEDIISRASLDQEAELHFTCVLNLFSGDSLHYCLERSKLYRHGLWARISAPTKSNITLPFFLKKISQSLCISFKFPWFSLSENTKPIKYATNCAAQDLSSRPRQW